MEIDLISEEILEVLEKRGIGAEWISKATPEEVFIEYTEWHGFRGWGKSLIGTLDSLRYASKAK